MVQYVELMAIAPEIVAEIESQLDEAVDGPFTEWTDDDVNDIRRLGTAILNRRKHA